MEKLTLTDTINQISQALAELESAKEDCKTVVESALDAYFGEFPPVDNKAQFELVKADRRTEAKNIKKLAKAMMTGDKEGLVAEVDNMKDLTDAIA